jgi:hypothetical protein
MGVVAGTLGFISLGVGQPGGLGLLGLAVVAAVTGWGVSGRARWARVLGFVVAIACAAAGVFGLHGPGALIDVGARPPATRLAIGFALGIGVAALSGFALSMVAEPPCCPL